MAFFDVKRMGWKGTNSLANKSFDCGFCGDRVSTVRGFAVTDGNNIQHAAIYICSNCEGPNFFETGTGRYPNPPFGQPVSNVPKDLNALYEEARRCTAQSCFTAAVLLCRKMLMNIAVSEKAKEGLKFIEYVDYLSNQGYIPPNGKHWVDHIRKKGNEATHEIALMTAQDAQELLIFTEMLLKFIYEFPSLVQPPPAAPPAQVPPNT